MIVETWPKCSCGCGEVVKVRRGIPNKYITGHNKANQKTPVRVECRNCKSVLYVPPASSGKNFCSAACRDAFRAAQVGPLSPYYKRVDLVCERCGNACQLTASELSRGRTPYCSAECGREARRLKLKALGESRADIHAWSYGRKAALVRDKRRCVVCGFSVALNVHHIVARAKGGSNHISNMITLCPNHHAMVHKNMLSAKYLKSLIDGSVSRVSLDARVKQQGDLFIS
jgi:hypothetical protein